MQSVIFSQTGPAGVQNSVTNVFWVKADVGTSSTVNGTPISAWNDQSGNNIHVLQPTANQQPTFATNVINGYPAILFDNTNASNDKLSAADNALLDNTSGYTFFMVTRPLIMDGNARCIVSKRTNVGVDQSFMHFFYSGFNLHTDIQTTNDRYNTTIAFSANTNILLTQQFEGTLAAASRCRTYVSGSLNVTASETSSLVPDNSSPLIIGSTDANDPRPFNGYISEVMIFRTALTSAPRIIIENYLSAKYNITLLSNDKYVGDNAGNGDYDRDVAGVGQEATGSSTSFSPSTAAGLGISVNSGLDNGDYILAGNAQSTNVALLTDVGGMTGAFNSRWQRVWYLDITNTSTAINANVTFDQSDASVPSFSYGPLSNYVLLYRPGQTGNWTELATASSTVGDVIAFNNISLTNDGYYTLGTKNFNVSLLPVELLDFMAVADEKNVNVSWATASEKNSDCFVLEKTEDGIKYEFVSKQPAAGQSNSLLNYKTSVPYSSEKNIYYRLTCFDKDGTFKYSPTVLVTAQNKFSVKVFPNPANNKITIDFENTVTESFTLEICDSGGRIIFTKQLISQSGKNEFIVDLDEIKIGTYIARIFSSNKNYSQRVIIK